MTSYRRFVSLPGTAVLAGESSGAYEADGPDRDGAFDPGDPARDHGDGAFDPDDPGPAGGSPLGGLADAIDELEVAKRRVLARYRDVAAWGGTANTTGYSQGEWLTLVGRLPGRESWKFDLLVRRLPATPVTAALLDRGEITVDQAVTILAATKRLSGDDLADVEATAAEAAAGRNRRGDDPDVDGDVELLVQQTRTAAEQDRRDRDRLERNSVRIQPDLFGAGRITADWADPEGFQTSVAALESAAGPPSPDMARGAQLAEGSLAMARAWLAGRDTHPLLAAASAPDGTGDDPTTQAAGGLGPSDNLAAVDVPDPLDTPDPPETPDRPALPTLPTSPDDIDLGPSAARPTIVVRVDVHDLAGIDPEDPDTLRWLATGSDAAFGRIASAGRLSSTAWLGRQLVDTLACNADLLVAIVDGERPLAEFRRTRRLPDRIRRQVLWRDLGCRWPACKAPIAHCDVHHLDQDPSNHDVDNLLALCRRHHRRLHSTFWHWRLDGSTGRFDLLRSPTGNPVHTTFPNGTNPRQLTGKEVD